MASFDYFTIENAEQYAFYRIPKELIKNDYYKSLSCEAKMLYGLMLDRLSLSVKNNWVYEDKVYIFFTKNQIMEDINCASEKAIKILKELDDIGLIERKKLCSNKASMIFVKNFSTLYINNDTSKASNGSKIELTVVRKSNLQWFENRTYNGSKIELTTVRKSNTSNTNINNTDINNTDMNNDDDDIFNTKENNVINISSSLNNNNNNNPFKYFENNINLLSPTQIQEIKDYLESLEDKLICKAIDLAIDKNARNWLYIKGILNNFLKNNILTIEQYNQHEKNYKDQKNNQGGFSHGNIGGNTRTTTSNKQTRSVEEKIAWGSGVYL